jgi:hypothetical protein
LLLHRRLQKIPPGMRRLGARWNEFLQIWHS